MKKVMISLPMRNRSDEDINRDFQKAKDKLLKMGFEVVESYLEGTDWEPQNMKGNGVKFIPLAYLAASLSCMATCDAVYFCKGWKNARGCRIEHLAAVGYGLQVFEE